MNLIEVIGVLAISAVLMGAMTPAVVSRIDADRRAQAQREMYALAADADAFVRAEARLPRMNGAFVLTSDGETYTIKGKGRSITRRYRSYLTVAAVPNALVLADGTRADRREDDLYIWSQPFPHGRILVTVMDTEGRETSAWAQLTGATTRLEIALP